MPSKARKVHNIGNVEISRETLPSTMQCIRLWDDANPVKSKNPVSHTLNIGDPNRQPSLLDCKEHLYRLNYAANVMAAETDHDCSGHFLLLFAVCVPIIMAGAMYI
jgi:hypothetical protein